jgi:DNA-binding GntR family transcriptional regulator
MNWIEKAQDWLRDNAARLFADWLKTKNGRHWQTKGQYADYRRKVRQRVHPNSPYYHGFSLPDYHHDLIKAAGNGDEETAKAIMLYHGIGVYTVGD